MMIIEEQTSRPPVSTKLVASQATALRLESWFRSAMASIHAVFEKGTQPLSSAVKEFPSGHRMVAEGRQTLARTGNPPNSGEFGYKKSFTTLQIKG
jgi:hypothetical protein